jgi:8-oxo-dGTP diphosphatase
MDSDLIAEPLNVAVGILVNREGEVLMAQRPDGKPYAGYWEFPGGKVESGEAIHDALLREFHEELGIKIDGGSVQPWCCCDYVYPHAHVRLHFFVCRAWQGEPQGLEGQQLAWQDAQFRVSPILPATIPLLEWLMPIDPQRN